ncbi:MAG: T9SS type A sorting domain-containing protein [Saprospiraceae bacterium]|nr:T9SS type A sorting domain-containing protein [Saprospiraceae bacterium]
MKTFIQTVVWLLLGSMTAFSQTLSPSVIALAGGLEKTPSGMTLSWTLGEPIVDPLRSGNVYLTQGFQQPDLKISTGFVDPGFEYSLEVFPNPTQADLILQSTYQGELSFRMVDVSGRLLREGNMQTREVIDISPLSAGVYVLYFVVEGKMVRSELISKQ